MLKGTARVVVVTVPPVNRREELTRIALALLEAEGPEAVSTRKVAAAYGASTMVVYSEFGSLAGLVASVVERGFAMLDEALRAAPVTKDPVLDLVHVGFAYREFAAARPDLYRVIYAVSPLVGHQRSGEELLQGAEAFGAALQVIRRAFRAGRFHVGSPYDATFGFWAGLHGLVLLQLAGYIDAVRPTVEDPLLQLVRTSAVGLGDDPGRIAASIEAALAD